MQLRNTNNHLFEIYSNVDWWNLISFSLLLLSPHSFLATVWILPTGYCPSLTAPMWSSTGCSYFRKYAPALACGLPGDLCFCTWNAVSLAALIFVLTGLFLPIFSASLSLSPDASQPWSPSRHSHSVWFSGNILIKIWFIYNHVMRSKFFTHLKDFISSYLFPTIYVDELLVARETVFFTVYTLYDVQNKKKTLP